jgi:hypothetical protein
MELSPSWEAASRSATQTSTFWIQALQKQNVRDLLSPTPDSTSITFIPGIGESIAQRLMPVSYLRSYE